MDKFWPYWLPILENVHVQPLTADPDHHLFEDTTWVSVTILTLNNINAYVKMCQMSTRQEMSNETIYTVQKKKKSKRDKILRNVSGDN